MTPLSGGFHSGSVWLLAVFALVCMGCAGEQKSEGQPSAASTADEQPPEPNKADLLAAHGVDPKLLNSLHCACFVEGRSSSTWLTEEERGKAAELLVSVLSQPEPEAGSTRDMMPVEQFFWCRERSEGTFETPPDCVVSLAILIGARDAAGIITVVKEPSQKIELVKRARLDKPTREKLSALVERVAARRDRDAKAQEGLRRK
jgi:hypothetical protein